MTRAAPTHVEPSLTSTMTWHVEHAREASHAPSRSISLSCATSRRFFPRGALEDPEIGDEEGLLLLLLLLLHHMGNRRAEASKKNN